MTTPIDSSFKKLTSIEENLHRELVTDSHPKGIADVTTEFLSYLPRDNRDKEFAPVARVCKNWHASSSNSRIANKQLESITTLTNKEIENWKIIFQNRYHQLLTSVELIQKCPNLRTLDFSNMDISDDELQKIVLGIANSRSIRELKFRDCKNLVDPSFEGLNFIQNLVFNGSSLLNAPCLEAMTSLSRLEISNCGRCAIYKFPDLPSLKIFKVNSCTLTINADFSNLLSLEELDFHGSTFASTSSYSFRGVPTVKKISFAYCENVNTLHISEPMPNLKELSFEGCQDFRGLTMKEHQVPPLLETVNFSKCNRIVNFSNLKIPSLKHLSFKDCGFLEEVDLTFLPFLETLDLSGCKLLMKLKYVPVHLQELFLANCYWLQSLSWNMKNLRILSLKGCRFKNVHLQKMSSLQKLDLRNCRLVTLIDFQGLHSLQKATLKGCTELRNIEFDNHPELTHLSLSNCSKISKINFTGARFLEKLWLNDCTSLENLNLSKLPNLKKLFIKNCPKLKSEAIDHFRDKIEIISD
ncbi:MAG TPA: leucine-rich repeat protein [Rhabdochlamydiaceae bacterium]|nr:leucine-rich repeat protein [Rhabdochlamydiaceae bacterium]